MDTLPAAATSMGSMEHSEVTDADLVSQTLAGNRDAFGCLFDRHGAMVRAVVGRVSRDWPTVEDMTQECFLRAFNRLASLRDRDQFGVWVVGIARHVARERRRTLRRDRHEFGNPANARATTSGVADLETAEQIEQLMQTLSNLPERERLAIHAHFLQEYNAQQAAELLNLSRSGFYALLKKALARLVATLNAHNQQEETKS